LTRGYRVSYYKIQKGDGNIEGCTRKTNSGDPKREVASKQTEARLSGRIAKIRIASPEKNVKKSSADTAILFITTGFRHMGVLDIVLLAVLLVWVDAYGLPLDEPYSQMIGRGRNGISSEISKRSGGIHQKRSPHHHGGQGNFKCYPAAAACAGEFGKTQTGKKIEKREFIFTDRR